MLDTMSWIIFAVIIFLALAMFYYNRKSKKKVKTDYYNLFISGIIWMCFGLIPDMTVFLIVGFAMMSIGLANRNKWKGRKKIKDNMKFIVLVVTSVVMSLMIAFVVIMILTKISA